MKKTILAVLFAITLVGTADQAYAAQATATEQKIEERKPFPWTIWIVIGAGFITSMTVTTLFTLKKGKQKK